MNNSQRVVMRLTGEAPNGAPAEPEDRPAPASRLPSWVINTKGTCTNGNCPDRIEGFRHRHVPGFPMAEHERLP